MVHPLSKVLTIPEKKRGSVSETSSGLHVFTLRHPEVAASTQTRLGEGRTYGWGYRWGYMKQRTHALLCRTSYLLQQLGG